MRDESEDPTREFMEEISEGPLSVSNCYNHNYFSTSYLFKISFLGFRARMFRGIRLPFIDGTRIGSR